MTEQFIPYEQALKLKDLGFDELCFTCYSNNGLLYRSDDWAYGFESQDINPNKNQSCLAPLWQQAFDWFREKHEFFSSPSESLQPDKKEYDWIIIKGMGGGRILIKMVGYKPTYNEARQACLDKLIELTETN